MFVACEPQVYKGTMCFDNSIGVALLVPIIDQSFFCLTVQLIAAAVPRKNTAVFFLGGAQVLSEEDRG
jgi:hypothetical protein